MDNWNSNHENEYTGMTAQRRNRRRSAPANGQIEGQIGMRLDPVVSDEEDRIEALVETNVPGVFSMPKEPDAAKEPEEPKKAAEAAEPANNEEPVITMEPITADEPETPAEPEKPVKAEEPKATEETEKETGKEEG